MLSRENFVAALQAIKDQEATLNEAEKVLQKLSDFHLSLDIDSLHRKALMKVLTEVMRDEDGWISWWLYEDVEKIVTWKEGNQEVSADLTDVNALYDFLVNEIRNAKPERLPLREYSGEPLFDEYPHKIIELDDFQTYFESALRYVDKENTVLHIYQGDEGKYVLMPIKCYEKMMGYTTSENQEERCDGSGTGDC